MEAKEYLDYPAVYTLTDKPATVQDWMREQNMLISMEKERQAKQFPWKRKGYRKHVK